MKTSLYIPKIIKVGYQKREGTYTKQLAYIIYYDEKGKLRKEPSWNSWRDNKIEPQEFDNIPTEGFVLNKKAGDYHGGHSWENRNAWIRVYDPRGYEFEISVENLLYILENSNSIKGKGLEGEFIYCWDGKDLVLMPVGSPDYKTIQEFSSIISENKIIKPKDLVIGGTYKDKEDKDWVYLGKYNSYDYYDNKKKGKKFYFAGESKYSWIKNSLNYISRSSLGNKFIKIVSEECVENYAELMDKLENQTEYSPEDQSKSKFVEYEFEEFKKELDNKYYWNSNFYSKTYSKRIKVYKKSNDNIFQVTNSDYHPYNSISKMTILYKSDSIEEIYNHIQPQKKNIYLKNGNFNRQEK